MQDIFELARKNISPSLIRSMFSSQGSYEQNGELWTKSPLRGDSEVGSFSINLTTGLYSDFAYPEHKGDFIDLVSKARGCALIDAAEIIAGEKVQVGAGKLVEKKKEKPAPVIPIPNTDENKKKLSARVQEKYCLTHWGTPEKISQYFNEKGEWIFSVCRFLKEETKASGKNKKNDIPFYLASDGRFWSSWHKDLLPWPPYGIEKIQNNELPGIIVEGEKCGRCTVEGYNVLSFTGGANRVKKTNWSLLENRETLIWPDCDSQRDKNGKLLPKNEQPGMKAALAIKAELPNSRILDIYKYKDIEEDPHGWDLFDCIEEGLDPSEVIEICLQEDEIEVEIDSHEVFDQFVKHFYGDNNLEQNGKVYWEYLKERHFWRPAVKQDIICNMQRWMEKTRLHYMVKNKVKPSTFFGEMKTWLDSYSQGYIYENPYKDSAIAPYLHVKNGAIQVSRQGSTFLSREEMGENYFKKLYPINCLDFDFDNTMMDNLDLSEACPCFNHFLNDVIPTGLKDKENYLDEVRKTKMMFAQVLAYSLIPIKPNEYNFGLLGNQRAGKSFFVKIVKSLVGADFCVERRIADMDSRFASADLWGKKVFIEPDMKTRQMLPEDFIKAYAGEQEITVERKNENPISGVKTSLALFFVSNYEFSVKGTEGVERRFIIINFKNKIGSPDTMLLDKILGKWQKGEEAGKFAGETWDERSGLLAFALRGWDEFIKNNFTFTLPDWVKADKKRWLEESNSVSNFMYETYLHAGVEISIARNDLYTRYKEWCSDNGQHAMGKINCFSEIRRLPGVIELAEARMFKLKGVYSDEVPF